MQRPKSSPRSRTPTTDQFLRICRGHVGQDYQYSNIRGQEIMMNQWRLMGYHWISCCNGQIPSKPVQCGRSTSGEHLYIARATTPGLTTCLGVFHQPSGLCHLFWEGRQFCSNQYEILCQGPAISRPQTVKYSENARRPKSRSTVSSQSEFNDLGQTLKVQSLRNPLRLSNMLKNKN
ncbi:hypothetical protein ACF0H5_013071 [Mactra antiquata]